MLCKLCLIYFSWTNLFSVFCLLPSDYKFLQTMQTPSAKLSIAMSIFICKQTKYKYKTEIIKNYFLETFNNFFYIFNFVRYVYCSKNLKYSQSQLHCHSNSKRLRFLFNSPHILIRRIAPAMDSMRYMAIPFHWYRTCQQIVQHLLKQHTPTIFAS